MSARLLHLIRDTLGTRVSPIAYLFAVKSALWGFLFWIVQSPGVRNTILFQENGKISIAVYGFTLFATSILLMVSMWRKSMRWTRVLSFILILINIWSTVVYFSSGFYDLMIWSGVDMFIWGYVYLASWLGKLETVDVLDIEREIG